MTSSSKTRTKSSPRSANKYYPVFLDLADKRCIIVGGGKVAERKCYSLIKTGAKVTVISPTLSQKLEGFKQDGLIKHIKRRYKHGDMQSAFVAIAATDSEDTNNRIAADAARHNVLLNIVDNPLLCSFIVPSTVRKTGLTIAISTGGVSPAMAKTIRKELEAFYGPDFSKYLRFLKDIRIKAKNNISDKRKRRKFLDEIASPDMIKLLRRKGFREAKRVATALLNS